MSGRGTYLAAVSLAVAACAESAPSAPTWVGDVRPILAANCVRCHRLPSAGGAPSSFRLDKYGDTTLADGTVIRGAATMARFVATRAGELGEMPPDSPRTDAQRDTLINWWATAEAQGEGALPELGTRGNEPPLAAALALPATADAEPIALRYQITDADGDLVDGYLAIGDGDAAVVASEGLRSGRGTVSIDPAALPDGEHTVAAVVTDDLDEATWTLGSITVAHASGNAAPRARVVAPAPHALIADLHSPFEITVEANDADGDPLTVDLAAVRGDDEIPIAEGVAVVDGSAAFAWDTSDVPEADSWRVRATVSDGAARTVIHSGRIVISHAPPDLGFDDVRPILIDHCTGCHPQAAIPGVGHDLGRWFDDPTGLGVSSLRGLIYLRVVRERTMPPPSAAALLDDFEPLDDAERALLGDYLLGGAPE